MRLWGNCLSTLGFSILICKKRTLKGRFLKVSPSTNVWGRMAFITGETLILVLNPVQVVGCPGRGHVLESVPWNLWFLPHGNERVGFEEIRILYLIEYSIE